MLHLAAPTDPAWTARALAALDEVLLDHAHCEKKAAGMAVQLLFRHPEHLFLQAPLAALAREELAHFERVLAALGARGIAFRRQRPSPYAGRLRRAVRSGEPQQLADTLLCCALIEARSCERFGLLARSVPDPELADLYAGLLASEARHYTVYFELAAQLLPQAELAERLGALARHEAEALALGSELPRMHA